MFKLFIRWLIFRSLPNAIYGENVFSIRVWQLSSALARDLLGKALSSRRWYKISPAKTMTIRNKRLQNYRNTVRVTANPFKDPARLHRPASCMKSLFSFRDYRWRCTNRRMPEGKRQFSDTNRRIQADKLAHPDLSWRVSVWILKSLRSLQHSIHWTCLKCLTCKVL